MMGNRGIEIEVGLKIKPFSIAGVKIKKEKRKKKWSTKTPQG